MSRILYGVSVDIRILSEFLNPGSIDSAFCDTSNLPMNLGKFLEKYAQPWMNKFTIAEHIHYGQEQFMNYVIIGVPVEGLESVESEANKTDDMDILLQWLASSCTDFSATGYFRIS